MPPNRKPRPQPPQHYHRGIAGTNSQASHALQGESAEPPSSGSRYDRRRKVDSAQVVEAGRLALRDLLKAGEDRVVYRDEQLQVLRPGDDGYWANSG